MCHKFILGLFLFIQNLFKEILCLELAGQVSLYSHVQLQRKVVFKTGFTRKNWFWNTVQKKGEKKTCYFMVKPCTERIRSKKSKDGEDLGWRRNGQEVFDNVIHEVECDAFPTIFTKVIEKKRIIFFAVFIQKGIEP